MADDGAVPTFGLWYDFRQRPPLDDYARFYDECFEEIEESERLGFAGVWLSEHHFVDDGYLPSPLIVAAALAARTERITVGTNVLLLPMHHPLRVAEDAAVADLVSGGRFVLGVGQGYVQHEFETFGFNRKYRPSLFEEGIEVIRRAFEKGRTGYEEAVALRGSAVRAAATAATTDLHRCLRRPRDRPRRQARGRLSGLHGRGCSRGYLPEGQGRLARHGRADEEVPFVASGVLYVHEDSERAAPTSRPPSHTSAAATPSGAPTGISRSPHRSSPRICRGRDTWSATRTRWRRV